MWRNGASLGLNDLEVLIPVKEGPMSLLLLLLLPLLFLPPPMTSEN